MIIHMFEGLNTCGVDGILIKLSLMRNTW